MKTGRISRTARPEIPSPALASPLPPIGPRPGRRPVVASYAQYSAPSRSSRRSIRAPSAPSSRAASSTASWRTSAGSRRAVIRAPISRSARSASARRSTSAREPASCVDQLGVGHRRGGVVGQRPDQGDVLLAERVATRAAYVPIAPNTRSPAISGATRNDRIAERLDESIGAREVDEARIGRVVAGHDDRSLARRPARTSRRRARP